MSYALTRAVDFIDQWLASQVDYEGIVGLSVALSHKDKIIFSSAYGWTDVAARQPLSPDHLFNIGSQAKMMTATLVMQLVQEGKVTLDDKAVGYLPWLSLHRDSRAAGITIGQLLAHRAGLVRDGLHAGFWQLEGDFPDAAALRRLVLAADITLDAHTKFKYSNIGYALLGQIIEAVTGRPYATVARERIIEPLGLANMYAEYAPDLKDRIATSYTRPMQGKRYIMPKSLPTNTFTSVAGWYANAADVCRFMAAHFTSDSQLVNEASRNQLHAPTYSHWVPRVKRGTQYGHGFMTHHLDGHRLVGHGGGFLGYRSYGCYDQNAQIGIAVLANAKDAPVLPAVRGILNILDYFIEHAVKPTPAKFDALRITGMNLLTTLAIVPTHDRIVALRLNEWLPFLQAEELEYKSPTRLIVAKASDLSSEGEQVTLTYTKDRLKSINYAGQMFYPQAIYAAWLQDHL